MIQKRVVFMLVILLGGLFLTACGGSDPTATAIPPKSVTLTATDIAYDTNDISVKAGQSVRLTLKNDGELEHDFSIMKIPLDGEVMGGEMEMEMEGGEHDMSNMEEEPEVHVAAMANGSKTITFVPSEPGEYEYRCTVEGHKEAGMVGTLTVNAP